jgi:hypothetical protein
MVPYSTEESPDLEDSAGLLAVQLAIFNWPKWALNELNNTVKMKGGLSERTS